jgi:DNA-binding SARP family transcriptional activator/ABC-type transport system substrate-binding protein
LVVRVSLTERISIEAAGVVVDEQRFPGRQGRVVFAYLLAAQGRPVPRDELAEALWGNLPPATWEKALSVLVSKLRALLNESGLRGSECLTSAFGCYQLTLPSDTWIDVVAADEAVTTAEHSLAAGELEQARAEASAAESIARRTFLPGEDGSWIEEERAALRETRVRALDCLAEAERLSGDSAAAIRAAEELIAMEPFRETGYRRLMEAHTAAGNRADALRVYERCRRLLAEELGAYPSPETEAIYRGLLEAPAAPAAAAVAVEAPVLDAAPAPARTPRKRVAAVTLAIAATVAAAAGVMVGRSAGEPPTTAVAPNSIVSLDPSGAIDAIVPVGARPSAISAAADALWVTNLDDRSVTRVDLASRQAMRNIPIGDTPTGIAATRTAVWVTDGSGRVSKIDPRYDRRTFSRPVRAAVGFFGGTARPAVAAFGSIWIVSPDGVVLRISPRSGRVVDSVTVGNVSSAIAAGAGSLWVTNGADGTVTRIDPDTLVTRNIEVGNGPSSVSVNAAGAWIANAGDNALVRVDVRTNAVVDTTPVGDGPAAVLATPTALWVANARDGTVTRHDPRSGKVTKTIRLGGTPSGLAEAGGLVWVTIAQSPPEAPPEGGARLTTQFDVTSLDPASGLWLFFYLTCANLVTYPDAPAPQGSRIVPEVAEAVPDPTAGGTVYTFRIRPGFRFSPPSNEVVTAMTFKSTIERVADPRLKSPLAGGFSGVVGYRAYVTGKARGISGIVARGATLTIRLSKPDGGFLGDIADEFACAVPRGTPAARGMNDIPSAGPYYIASYTPRQQLVLQRNPNYRGHRPHRLERIVLAIGIDPVRGLAQVEAGTADYALELPREAGPRLESAFGPSSEPAKAGHQRYFISEALGARVLNMNASRPLFSDARLRRAVNYAIDRAALAAQGRRAAEVNPFNSGSPTDDYLPPAANGAADLRLYPLDGPDVRRAKRIAGRVHARAIMYTPNLSPWREEAQIVRRNLAPLGINVEVKEFPIANFFTRVTGPGEPFDLAVGGYHASPDPVVILGSLFDGPTNIPHLHDATLSRKLEAIAKLSGTKRYRAAGRLAHELQRDLVPAAAFATTASRDFFSARIGCQVYHPVWGMDLATLCLRD